MTKLTIPCTRCNGEGFFEGFGICFKCEGTKVNTVTEKQYKEYYTKKENASTYVMFDKSNGSVVRLFDKDMNRATTENFKLNLGGKTIPVLKLQLDGTDYIAIKYSHDYMLVLTELTKLFNKKLGKVLSDTEATEIVNGGLK